MNFMAKIGKERKKSLWERRKRWCIQVGDLGLKGERGGGEREGERGLNFVICFILCGRPQN